MLSRNDKMLMGNDDDDDAIQPNSQYDMSINFNDDPEPGQFSPRPDPNEALPDAQFIHELGNGTSLSDFQLDLNGANGFSSNNNNFNFGSNMGAGMNNMGGGMNDGFSNFSPRPDSTPGIDFGNDPAFNNSNFGNIGNRNFGNNPGNFPNAPELAPLFAMISNFQPPPLEISPHFKPFLPELVPSIGAIDAFIKVPRPDGEQDPLGLILLDEPSIGCSNPQILKMQLREKFSVVSGASASQGDGYIGFIEKPTENGGKELSSFLESYDEISRNRAAPNIAYSYKMPELEELMDFWPDELEKAFNSLPLPNADMDMSLEEFIRVYCALLDIPVKGNVVESLHVMFTLYQQFKENHYFTNADSNGNNTLKNDS
ncbi:hypothetical protein TRFO_23877 [Tritrichomonas foetus]|uniref:Intraflagellar transport protein 46 like protein n=1 Tax=Tritrichomonas foetus TaxID=1144522 RepID=A0A1J4K8N9_9EUKA|nr:hypothetical protein TRFO_23877 [Tritrichomonas foetus]|eukprot:OHT07775.1 hypothetical protein TRFO_23877 [Tritrichomonas foetus]